MEARVQAVRFVSPDGEVRIGRLTNGRIHDGFPSEPRGFVPTTEAWTALEVDAGPSYPIGSVRLLPPVVPRKLICVGGNYRAHLEESDVPPPPAPVLFSKLPSAIIGPDDPIILPHGTDTTDFEAEVAILIGRWTRDAEETEALSAIGGYTAINDVTDRTAQERDGQWTRSKSFDSYAPIGPTVCKPDGIDPAIRLACRVSGELMQESSTSDLVYSMVDLIVYISRNITLAPGDLIATGTPGGVGFARAPQRFLKHQDLLETWVEGVGVLRNPVIAADLCWTEEP